MNDINIKRIESQLITNSIQKTNFAPKKDFNQILDGLKNKDEIKFSKHAMERLGERKINLNTNELDRLKSAFEKAENKGVKDALILMDDKAFVANIKNKVVITTVNKDELKENVFTNIDGALII